MQYAWRWFGKGDPVSLDDIRQAGAEHVVSALHHVPIGEVWSSAEIAAHKQAIESKNGVRSPLYWSIVESIPVHDDIKRGATGEGWQKYADNFIQSCRNLAENNIFCVVYNFMPLLDWTRTDLAFELPNGGRTLRFDFIAYAAYDLHILKRPNAKSDYDSATLKKAEDYYNALDDMAIGKLTDNLIAGLPGGMTGTRGLEKFRQELLLYKDISDDDYRQNLVNFLKYVIPACEEVGVRLALHPDDPPYRLFGVPRVVSTYDDHRFILESVPSDSNGLTFCPGSLVVRKDNNVLKMLKDFGMRCHFFHLRGTASDPDEWRSFQESEHLGSEVDMVAIIAEILKIEKQQGRQLPFRPDHGHQLLDDLQKPINPGYSAIGRLKAMAELRGVITALSHGQMRSE